MTCSVLREPDCGDPDWNKIGTKHVSGTVINWDGKMGGKSCEGYTVLFHSSKVKDKVSPGRRNEPHERKF